MNYQITICGGGNAAHTLAGLLSSQPNLSVHIFAPYGNEAEQWQMGIRSSGGIKVHTQEGLRMGRPNLISADAHSAVRGSQLVILALPAFAHEDTLSQIAPHLQKGTWLGAMPARGGFDLAVRDVLGDLAAQIVIFGFQTLPWACRVQKYGQEAQILGTKEVVDIAALPPTQALIIASQLQELLGLHLNPVDNFLSLTLADTGQIIHPGIMYGLFHNWDGTPAEKPPLFYQSVDENIASILQQMSNEILSLRNTLVKLYSDLNLNSVLSIEEWLKRSYHSNIVDDSSLQSCFATNRSYAGLQAPMLKTETGFVPDFQARYLSEDIPYNLLVTRGIAELTNISTPTIDKVIYWAQARLAMEYIDSGKLTGRDLYKTRSPQRYGFKELNRFLQEANYR